MFFDLRLFFTSALALLAIVTIASAQTSPPVRGEIEGRQSEGSSYFGESQKNSSILCAVNSVINSLTGDVGSVYNSLTSDVASGWKGGTSYLGSLGDGVYGTLTCKFDITVNSQECTLNDP